MDSKKALERLVWRFSTGKAFTPNQNDKEALNSIILLYNEDRSTLNYSQDPFAKMYLFLYLNLLRKREYDDSTITPARILHRVLDNPLSVLVSEITENINSMITANYLKEKGIDMDNPLKKEGENKLSDTDIDKIMSIQKTYDEINDILIGNINNILDNYK